MPLINNEPTAFDREIQLLESSGISVKSKERIEDRFHSQMLDGGLSPEEVVYTISRILAEGENSSVKLAAAKMALSMYMHPAFVPRKESERAEAPVINISIAGGNVQLANVLRPTEQKVIDI